MLRWSKGDGTCPGRIPLSIDGRLADMSVAGDGSIYVLESVAPPGRHPLLRRFDENGRDLDVVETAERPSQIRRRRRRPGRARAAVQPVDACRARRATGLVHAAARARTIRAPPTRRRRGGRAATRRARFGSRSCKPERLRRAWRITSTTPLGEVQLAEPMGQRLVLVVRAYSDTAERVRRPDPRSEGARGRASRSTPRTGPSLRRSAASAS